MFNLLQKSGLADCWTSLDKSQQRHAAKLYFTQATPDPVDWAINHAGFTPDPWQAEVLWFEEKRLLLNCSRQSGKSITTAHKALHHALYHPGALILLVSPSLRQSSELFRKVLDVVAKLPTRPALEEDNKLSLKLSENGSRIVSLPSSEGTIRGFSGASQIIIDEASRVPDALYNALRPMLAVNEGQLILMSTPFGRRGFFFEEWERITRWKRIEITADKCPRISAEFLQEEQEALGEWWYKQEYQCAFVETIDQLFSFESLRAAMDDEVTPLFVTDPLEGVWTNTNNGVHV